MMDHTKYKPCKFYITVFAFTWAFWIAAALGIRAGAAESTGLTLMMLGLFVPPVVAIVMVFSSKSKPLKADFKQKLVGFYRLHPVNILLSVLIFAGIVALSILISVLLGGSTGQFALVEGFSFSIQGSSALLTILLASVVEELGWRGYGEDAVANYCCWFTESILFGAIWSAWHIPLFFIEGTYQHGLTLLGPMYVANFLLSVIPLGFITTWVYVKNNRSMLACIVFHLFVNFMQEKIAMTPETKCIESFVIAAVAAVLVWRNRELFFEKKHIGRLLEDDRRLQSV